LQSLHQAREAVFGVLLLETYGQKLWQRYGHDYVLRDSEQTGDVIRYILENPVKAGLCARAHDYPFAGVAVESGFSRAF
jgi:hypothetical protein